ncbi:hypothetical protein U716_01675 [Rhodobacter capsulatus B6]|nr:hypothetical protein U716_01675 [Rhodobacter capsulatus B6]
MVMLLSPEAIPQDGQFCIRLYTSAQSRVKLSRGTGLELF